jgi:hypothetical protein
MSAIGTDKGLRLSIKPSLNGIRPCLTAFGLLVVALGAIDSDPTVTGMIDPAIRVDSKPIVMKTLWLVVRTCFPVLGTGPVDDCIPLG